MKHLDANYKQVPVKDLSNVKVGDLVVRALAGTIPMTCIVGYIDNDVIKVGSEDGYITWEEGWTFDIKTGAEIDEYFNWGPKSGVTGSYITHIIEK